MAKRKVQHKGKTYAVNEANEPDEPKDNRPPFTSWPCDEDGLPINPTTGKAYKTILKIQTISECIDEIMTDPVEQLRLARVFADIRESVAKYELEKQANEGIDE